MKKKVKKELREWIILLGVIGILYITGLHTEVIGRIQQAFLATGIITPDKVEEERVASFDFVLEAMDGEEVPFEAFEEKTVFLNFWATWCPPCVAEMPDIHGLFEETGEEVAFVMVSLDKEEEKARKFIERKGFEFPVYFLRSGLPDSYEVHSIPTTYVIDKAGKIRVENEGMAKYNTASFRAFLEELP